MKTILKPVIGFLVIIITNFSCLAQETPERLINEKETPKNYDRNNDEKVSQPINTITKVSTNNGIITYAIVNEKIKKELYFNQEKRDALTALPGFIELGLSTDNTPMRVLIESDYAEEYLNTYFRVNANQSRNK